MQTRGQNSIYKKLSIIIPSKLYQKNYQYRLIIDRIMMRRSWPDQRYSRATAGIEPSPAGTISDPGGNPENQGTSRWVSSGGGCRSSEPMKKNGSRRGSSEEEEEEIRRLQRREAQKAENVMHLICWGPKQQFSNCFTLIFLLKSYIYIYIYLRPPPLRCTDMVVFQFSQRLRNLIK